MIDERHPHFATMGAEPIDNAVLAMAYVPMQKFGRLYNNEDALCAGTMFADLDKPFCGCTGGRK